MDYEDRLQVWCVALKKGTAYWDGRGLLIPVQQAVKELNASAEVGQLRGAELKRIVAEFKDTAPPYPSFDPRMKLFLEKQRERTAERAAKHRAYMRERMRKKRAAGEQVPPQFCGSKGIDTGPPEIWAKTAKRAIDSIGKF